MIIERRPALTFLAHLVLLLGVLVVAFPIYLTWVASTQTAQQIHQGLPMSLWPGNHFFETYSLALWVESTRWDRPCHPCGRCSRSV